MAFTIAEGPLQEAPLHRVGVLELIHHHGPIALLQRRKPSDVAITGIHRRQQSGKGDHTATAAAAVQLLQASLQQVLPGALQRCIPERCDGGLQSRHHKAGVGFTALPRDTAPTGGVEVLLQWLLMGRNLQQRGNSRLDTEPLINLRTAIALRLGGVGGGGTTSLGFPLFRGLAEPGIKGGMVPVPEREKVLPELRHPVVQLRCEGAVHIDCRFAGSEARLLFAIELR